LTFPLISVTTSTPTARDANRARVFELIHLRRAPSRAEIATALELTPPP